MIHPVLVLFSGGLDSTVLLYELANRGLHTVALDFQFPGRLKAEMSASENLARQAPAVRRFVRIDLPFISPPKEELSAYIPKRNLMFYGIAATLAEQWDLEEIYGGHILPDRRVFPDARREYFDSLNQLISASSGANKIPKYRIVTPFIDMEKEEVIAVGKRLGVPFKLTWGCLRDGTEPCGSCSSCNKRKMAFAKAGVDDSLN